MIKTQESLSDIGKPDKVNVLHIFKYYAWSAFVQKFEAFVRAVNDSVLGAPELLTQFQSISQPPRPILAATHARPRAAAADTDSDATESLDESTERAAGRSTIPAASMKDDVETDDEEGGQEDGEGDDDEEDDEEEDDDDLPETQRSQRSSTRSAQLELRRTAKQLKVAVTSRVDPLADVLADTAPAATSVLTTRSKANPSGDSTTHKENVPNSAAAVRAKATRASKPGSFVGKRDTSIAVAFDDSLDSMDELEDRPALPKHSTAPLPSFAPLLAPARNGPSSKRRHPELSQDSVGSKKVRSSVLNPRSQVSC